METYVQSASLPYLAYLLLNLYLLQLLSLPFPSHLMFAPIISRVTSYDFRHAMHNGNRTCSACERRHDI